MKHFINAVGRVSDRLYVAVLVAGLVSQVESVEEDRGYMKDWELLLEPQNEHHAGYFQF